MIFLGWKRHLHIHVFTTHIVFRHAPIKFSAIYVMVEVMVDWTNPYSDVQNHHTMTFVFSQVRQVYDAKLYSKQTFQYRWIRRDLTNLCPQLPNHRSYSPFSRVPLFSGSTAASPRCLHVHENRWTSWRFASRKTTGLEQAQAMRMTSCTVWATSDRESASAVPPGAWKRFAWVNCICSKHRSW